MNQPPALIPTPRKMSFSGRKVSIGPSTPMDIAFTDPRVERAALAWRRGFQPPADESPAEPCREIAIRLAEDGRGRARIRDGGYRLTVKRERLLLEGGSPVACFAGLQTLLQLSRFELGEAPCCEIDDWPSFAIRGLLHDVTRGKVPTLATLKRLVDRLALLKVNQLQLNIEHAFAFSFDSSICSASDGLTVDDVAELDQYCHDRFIDLVPALATLGHMGRILSMPRYRHLAEIPTEKSWPTMSWRERMRGLTLNSADPEAQLLAERMWSDILDAFSGPVVNLCGDEPHDLGKNGRDAGNLIDPAELYAAHLLRTHELCAARGRRTQMWCDVLRSYPHMVDRISDEVALLHWGYDDDAQYDFTPMLVASGRKTIVCPGTSGWKRLVNAMNAAERNIATFAEVGERCGAAGLINTDWGDDGHVNLLGCSWHGIALGAAFAWRSDHPLGKAFDDSFARLILGKIDASIVPLLREASDLGTLVDAWSLFRTPLRELAGCDTLPTADCLSRALSAALEARSKLAADAVLNSDTKQDAADLATACELQSLMLQKLLLARAASEATPTSGDKATDLKDWADRVAEASNAFASCWRARNKESGLTDILAAFERIGADMGAQDR